MLGERKMNKKKKLLSRKIVKEPLGDPSEGSFLTVLLPVHSSDSNL